MWMTTEGETFAIEENKRKKCDEKKFQRIEEIVVIQVKTSPGHDDKVHLAIRSLIERLEVYELKSSVESILPLVAAGEGNSEFKPLP